MDTADAEVRPGSGAETKQHKPPLMDPMAPESVDRLRTGAKRQRRRATLLGIMRRLGWTSITLGLLILGFVAHQLWVTSFFAQQQQGDLEKEREEHFASVQVEEVAYLPSGASGGGGPEIVIDPETGEATPPPTLLVESPPEESVAFALLRIPKIERLQDGWNVVEGVRLSDLKNGAGHMPHTPLPGQPGNSVISGHRTTYGQPFHELDILEAGDLIYVDTAIGTHAYAVREVFIVQPTELWVTDPKEGAWLTLTTCNPRFSARERLIVQAELVDGPNADVILGTT